MKSSDNRNWEMEQFPDSKDVFSTVLKYNTYNIKANTEWY